MNADGLNFYQSGNGCANTGELAGVIVHEWYVKMEIVGDIELSIFSSL